VDPPGLEDPASQLFLARPEALELQARPWVQYIRSSLWALPDRRWKGLVLRASPWAQCFQCAQYFPVRRWAPMRRWDQWSQSDQRGQSLPCLPWPLERPPLLQSLEDQSVLSEPNDILEDQGVDRPDLYRHKRYPCSFY
jgi:hypothetical protein